MNYRILKYFYISFLIIAIFFSFVTTARVLYHYVPNMTMLGERAETLGFYSFWADILGSTASFTMIFITAVSVNLNEKQLKELKRQWDEEHSPYLSCQLIVSGNYFKLRVHNSASVVADNVSIGIENYLRDTDIYRFDKLKDFLSSHSLVIPPNESIYFDILITAYKDIENLPQGHIEVSMKSSKKDFGKFQLYPSNYAFISFEKENIGHAVVESISKVSKTIENKRYLFK